MLLLDEPTSGLDPRATADFNALLLKVRDRGTAVLMVTHDLLSAADVADRIAFLEQGRIVEDVTATGSERIRHSRPACAVPSRRRDPCR
ncbi:hypothetical protein QP185_21680 [Sphingomonas aerolata]|uniref:hypothetical protein n=1 Tax=Sphingomonas aerolata TaxID=185951 RepID=UPI002FE392B2